MPLIKFVKERQPIDVPTGANLMEALLAAGLPVASSCYGDAVCGKCRIEVIEGSANLSSLNPDETLLADRHKLPKAVRISCQTRVLGDVTIDAPYW